MKRALWLTASWPVQVASYAALIVASIWVLVPFLWAVVNSIKGLTDTFNPAAVIPFADFAPTFAAWAKVIGDPGSMRALMNSCVVSFATTLLVLVLATPAAYSLARFEFPIRSKHINFWFFSQRVMPPVVVLVPFFILLAQLGLVDTRTGLTLIYTTFNLAFAVVILRDVFRDIARDIDDAARVDGANTWQIFWLIALPLSLDGLVVTSVIVFASCWNEALFASALAQQHAGTIATFILASRGTRGIDFSLSAVTTLIAIMPPVILSLFVQRYLARGLSFGTVKG